MRILGVIAEYAKKAYHLVTTMDVDMVLDRGAEKTGVEQSRIFAVFVLMAASVSLVLFAKGVGKIARGVPAMFEEKKLIEKKDVELYEALRGMPEKKTGRLQDNVDGMSRLQQHMIGELKIDTIEDAQKSQGDKKGQTIYNYGLDRFGQFRRFVLTYKGDMYEQLYLLKLLRELDHFAFIEEINGKGDSVTIILKVYGS